MLQVELLSTGLTSLTKKQNYIGFLCRTGGLILVHYRCFTAHKFHIWVTGKVPKMHVFKLIVASLNVMTSYAVRISIIIDPFNYPSRSYGRGKTVKNIN